MKETDPERMRHIELMARDIGNRIGAAINRADAKKQYGFALILFSYEGSELTYISSANRKDMVEVLQEMLSKLHSEEPGTSADRN